MGSVFYWLHVDGLSTIAIHDNATDDHIFAAYRLFGLSERDAVAELREESDKYFAELNYERERNAALVAGLESLKKEHGLEYGFLRGERPVLNNIGESIDELIAANEKGGANG